MKKETESKVTRIVMIVIFILFLMFLVFVLYLATKNNMPELSVGEPADEFCEDKCEKDLISSNENIDYNFIRCECLLEVGLGDGKYTKVANIKTFSFYFDSETFLEMTRSEVLDRIKE